jgi:hypothetical protein
MLPTQPRRYAARDSNPGPWADAAGSRVVGGGHNAAVRTHAEQVRSDPHRLIGVTTAMSAS